MSEIEIRAAKEDDAPALVALLEQLHPRYPGEPHQAARLLTEVLDIPRRSLLVATTPGMVVGTVDLQIVPNITHRGRPWAIIEKPRRRRGSARNRCRQGPRGRSSEPCEP
jgi:uncharacterized protein YjeT (DUF2065 family)